MKTARFFIILFLIVVAVAFTVDVYRSVFRPFSGFEPPLDVTIPPGRTVGQIAALLADKGLISRASYFKAYYRLFFADKTLKAGDYRFERPLTMAELIHRLNEGKVTLYKIVCQEGMTSREIAGYLEKTLNTDARAFLAACRKTELIKQLSPEAEDLEGYLFPDTYWVRRDMSAEDLVRLMVRRFQEKFSNSLIWRARDIDFTVQHAVILASLIEKESASRDERFLISSVFHNRLRLGMLLDCDPTIIYALKKEGRYGGQLGWKDLKYDSPYNTRLHRGLPPGPICNPGLASLEAALYPENTRYLYFVAKDSRSHVFSQTLKEHNQAVRKYIIDRFHDVP